MKYEELSPITRLEAESILEQDIQQEDRIELLLKLSLSPEEVHWKQELFESLLLNGTLEDKRAAIQSLGHLSRLSNEFNSESALKHLKSAENDHDLIGYIEDAIDDIKIFAKKS